MIVIIGKANSGKSAYAEELALKYSNGKEMAYIATMIPFDAEGLKRIERHKELRRGKKFITYEKATQIQTIAKDIESKCIDTALLECVSNLVGNEIYDKNNHELGDEKIVQIIVNEIKALAKRIQNLIVVSNEFEIKKTFDDETIRYIKINHMVNNELKKEARQTIILESGEWNIYDNY